MKAEHLHLRFSYLILVGLALAAPLRAQELPYFVTYSHHLEERGSLELENKSVTGAPGGNQFLGSSLELEYGTRAWWTTELYLDGQSTAHDSTVFTGFRIENRVRPLLLERGINPVLYFEFEDINGANKSLLEVVGHDGDSDLTADTHETRSERKREVELKLILSSNAKGWNFSENMIAEKNLNNSPWEFGYTLAASRPLRFAGSPHPRFYSPERLQAGAELYGGLGDRHRFGFDQTSHYFGPTVNWGLPAAVTLSFAPQFGLTDQSVSHLYRVGVSYEVGQLSRFLHSRQENNR